MNLRNIVEEAAAGYGHRLAARKSKLIPIMYRDDNVIFNSDSTGVQKVQERSGIQVSP